MGTALTDVMVHVDEALNEDAILRLEQDVRADEGVVAVGHRPGRSHLVMVVYDSDIVPAAQLLHAFQDRGLHAQLVGF